MLWRRIYLKDRPMQTDGYNCAIFVMFYMNALATKLPLTRNNSFNPNVHRSIIAQNLVRYSKDIKMMCLYCENESSNEDSNTYQTCKSCKRWAHLHCINRIMNHGNEDPLHSKNIFLLCNSHTK